MAEGKFLRHSQVGKQTEVCKIVVFHKIIIKITFTFQSDL